jgi:hypothetical protein
MRKRLAADNRSVGDAGSRVVWVMPAVEYENDVSVKLGR